MSKKDIVLKKKNNNLIYIGIIAVLVIIITFLVLPSNKQEKQVAQKPLDIPTTTDTNTKTNTGNRYTVVKDVDGSISFPVSSFDDTAQYFEYQFKNGSVKFFILKSNDGTIRAAFDACDVCFASKRGYNQVGDFMQCNNCGQSFPEDQINVVLGGCNPSPLTREIIGDNLIIKVEDIALGKRFF